VTGAPRLRKRTPSPTAREAAGRGIVTVARRKGVPDRVRRTEIPMQRLLISSASLLLVGALIFAFSDILRGLNYVELTRSLRRLPTSAVLFSVLATGVSFAALSVGRLPHCATSAPAFLSPLLRLRVSPAAPWATRSDSVC
jgi:hypothetical protein